MIGKTAVEIEEAILLAVEAAGHYTRFLVEDLKAQQAICSMVSKRL